MVNAKQVLVPRARRGCAKVRKRRRIYVRRIHPTTSLTALLLLCVALSQHSFAAAAWPALPDLTAFLMLRTEAGKSQSLITIEKAADGLKGYDVILFGEFHDHAGNHLAEMQLFRAVFAREPKLALS